MPGNRPALSKRWSQACRARSIQLSPPTVANWSTFPIAAATVACRRVNYTVFVFFLTPLFVLVTELLHPGVLRYLREVKLSQ